MIKSKIDTKSKWLYHNDPEYRNKVKEINRIYQKKYRNKGLKSPPKIKTCKVCNSDFVVKGRGNVLREVCYNEECKKKYLRDYYRKYRKNKK